MSSGSTASINIDDIGLDLCVLVCHLFERCAHTAVALKELSLRCQCPVSRLDLSKCTGIHTVHETQWYSTMKQRFAEETQRVQAQRESDLAESEGLVRSLYPNGCSLSEYADAVQTCAAMFPFSLSGDVINRFVDQEGATLSARQVHSLSLDDLLTGLVKRLIVPSLLPARWWSVWRGERHTMPFVATRVGVSVAPLRIAIEYRHTESGTLATRAVPLRAHLTPHGPTAPLARRLVAAHGSIVSEAVLQKALVTLQRLLQMGSNSPSAAPYTAPAASATTGGPDPLKRESVSSASSTSRAAVPQKADLGLLYRDPEKALENVDLNDADDMTVKEFKEAMDVKFSSNVLRPGDEGYVYDRRVEFKPTLKSEWDDDSD